MATFSQWMRTRKVTRVAWVCGAEHALARTVRDAYREALPAAEPYVLWGDAPGVWDDLLTAPGTPRLVVVQAAQALKSLDVLPYLLGDEFDVSYVVFMSSEDDFRKSDKALVPALAALRDSKHGQLIRCCVPTDPEGQADIVAAWWPGAGRNVASSLLAACGGSLTGARHAADKAVRAGLAPDVKAISFISPAAVTQGFADMLVRSDRRGAMEAAQSVPDDGLGPVIGLLSSRVTLIPLVRDAIARREQPADTVRRLKADAWVLRQLRSYAGDYPPERVDRCRELLAVAESAWRGGAREGVLEAMAALWLRGRISTMSEVRDPGTDQPLPVPGSRQVHQSVIDHLGEWCLDPEVQRAIDQGLQARRELGIRKYGRPLEADNGRDALQDAWEEALDAMAYIHQLELEGQQAGLAGAAILSVAEALARMKLDRGDVEVR